MSIQGARCAAKLRSSDPPTNAVVAAHIGQTSLKQYPSKCSSEILVEDGVDDGIQD